MKIELTIDSYIEIVMNGSDDKFFILELDAFNFLNKLDGAFPRNKIQATIRIFDSNPIIMRQLQNRSGQTALQLNFRKFPLQELLPLTRQST
jgi:hypothetical protein